MIIRSRGHSRSDQTWHGNDINRQYADDLALLIETLRSARSDPEAIPPAAAKWPRYIGVGDRVAKSGADKRRAAADAANASQQKGTPMAAAGSIRSGVAGNRSPVLQRAGGAVLWLPATR